MILQSAMARIRRKGGLIEILLFFSHEMFIKTFRQIVKLFERTNIFSRKFDKREKLRRHAERALHCALRILREGRSSVCGAANKVYGMSHVLHAEAKKGGSLAGASFSKSGNLLGNDFLKILAAKCGQTGFCPS